MTENLPYSSSQTKKKLGCPDKRVYNKKGFDLSLKRKSEEAIVAAFSKI
jgi:hypothetical protein